eukprot:607437-Pyramimonas_sp.AAC.1
MDGSYYLQRALCGRPRKVGEQATSRRQSSQSVKCQSDAAVRGQPARSPPRAGRLLGSSYHPQGNINPLVTPWAWHICWPPRPS